MNKTNKSLLDIVDRFKNKKIAVWGDFILDEYIFGNTNRISREAPVLILTFKNRKFYLGGAGNSVLNLHALGANPLPIGIYGPDESGNKIVEFMKEKGIKAKYLFCEKNYRTPIKTRILAGEETARKQQILRIDQEQTVPDKKEIKKKMEDSLIFMKDKIDALLISDYNYFTVKEDIFDKIISQMKKKSIPITLDSRFRLLNFPRVNISTPNEPEVEYSSGFKIENDDILNQCGHFLLEKTQSEAILITRGSKGMDLFEQKHPPFHLPIHGSTEIIDGAGAGDTVISVLTLALSSGASFKQAAQLANYAGGIVVMKKGTATLSIQELKKAVTS